MPHEPAMADTPLPTATEEQTRSRPRRVNKRTAPPSAGWKGRLISRCLERAKQSRESVLSETRRRATLAREWRESLSQESETWNALSDGSTSGRDAMGELSEAEMQDLLLQLELALDEERCLEEEALVKAASDLMLSSKAEEDADIAELSMFQERTQAVPYDQFVLCPVCAASALHVAHGVVFCQCGMRVNGGAHENLSLDEVRLRLAMVMEKHATTGCKRTPNFRVQKLPLVQYEFLVAECDACDFSEVAF